jgi:hypothetical protein
MTNKFNMLQCIKIEIQTFYETVNNGSVKIDSIP